MGNSPQLVVRLDAATLKRIDAYAEELRAENPGPAWTRSDAARKLLSIGLDALAAKPRTRPKKK